MISKHLEEWILDFANDNSKNLMENNGVNNMTNIPSEEKESENGKTS